MKLYEKASILFKLVTNVDWTIAFVKAYFVLTFFLPWPRGDISKFPQIAILRLFFHQN
jgi:hypothetical protein